MKTKNKKKEKLIKKVEQRVEWCQGCGGSGIAERRNSFGYPVAFECGGCDGYGKIILVTEYTYQS